jgi:hypothetical protein
MVIGCRQRSVIILVQLGSMSVFLTIALSYSLAHLAVPYGGRQDARLEPKYIQLPQPGWVRVPGLLSHHDIQLGK